MRENQGSLDLQFRSFLDDLAEVENLDRMDLSEVPNDRRGCKKADYLGWNRSVVIEVKALGSDREAAVRAVIAPEALKSDWPTFTGTLDIQDVLSAHSRGQEINAKLRDSATSSIAGLYVKANRQVRETKRTFSLRDARGLLILLNDVADVLEPAVVVKALHYLYFKRRADGERRFPELDGILYVPGIHRVGTTGDVGLQAAIAISDGDSPCPHLKQAFDQLITGWAAHQGIPVVEQREGLTVQDLDSMEFTGPSPSMEIDVGS